MSRISQTPYATTLMRAAAGADIADEEIATLELPPGADSASFVKATRETIDMIRATRATGAHGPARREARLAAYAYAGAFDPAEIPAEPRRTSEIDESDPRALAEAVTAFGRNGSRTGRHTSPRQTRDPNLLQFLESVATAESST